jgi:hypothetical protein
MNLSKIGEIKFNDVYYVPKLIMNLISIGSLVDQSFFFFFFNNEKCSIFVGPNHVVVVELQSRRLTCINISWMTYNFLFVLWNFIL